MTPLIRYDAARLALRVATQVDDVKDIRDKAQALAAYARQAKDTDLQRWATEIKLRAERRVGEILTEMAKNKGGNPNLAPTGALGVPVAETKLADVGISKKQSSKFQAVAAVTEERFEAEIATGKATTASLAREGARVQEEQALKVIAEKGSDKLRAVAQANEAMAKYLARVAESPKKEQDKAAKTVKEKAKIRPKPAPVLTVPKKQYDELERKYALLQENAIELGEMLEACDAVRANEHVVKIMKLHEEIKYLTRRRNELMNQCAEMRKQLNFYERELKKLGWNQRLPKKAPAHA